jgi:hypothetical protein
MPKPTMELQMIRQAKLNIAREQPQPDWMPADIVRAAERELERSK